MTDPAPRFVADHGSAASGTPDAVSLELDEIVADSMQRLQAAATADDPVVGTSICVIRRSGYADSATLQREDALEDADLLAAVTLVDGVLQDETNRQVAALLHKGLRYLRFALQVRTGGDPAVNTRH